MENTGLQKNETDLSLIINSESHEKSKAVDKIVSTFLSSNLTGLSYTISRATVIKKIDEFLDDAVMTPILALQGKRYGFLTDCKGSEKYPAEVVKDCFIEAILLGVEPTANQFNIIAGKCYVTKEGCRNKLNKLGVYADVSFGISFKDENQVTKMPTTIEWVDANGRGGTKTIDFPISVHEKTQETAKRGMAERDILDWLIKKLTGIQMPLGDVSDKNAFEIKQTKAEKIEEMVKENGKMQPEKPVENKNEKIEEAEIVKEEENLPMLSQDRQVKFDNYVTSKAVTSKDILIKRGIDCCESYKVKMSQVDLTAYNKKMAEFQD